MREKDLEIVGKFGSTSIARVHGDTDEARRLQGDSCSLEHERREVGYHGSLD